MSLTDSSPLEVAKAASISSRNLAILSTEARNDALTAIHGALQETKDIILAANAKDLELATKAAEDGELSQSVLKRLDLGRKGKWEDMLQGVLDVRDLEDPGGKETTLSFRAISTTISNALTNTLVPNASIQLVTARDVIASLLDLDKHIDLVIPRGSNELVRYIKDNTRIPVLGHADGICSTYIHKDADPEMAVKILVDAKLGYPAACNAVETLLVDEAALSTILPAVASALLEKGVSLRCDAESKSALAASLPKNESTILQDATEEDYTTEFLAPILAIKTIPTPPDASASTSCSLAIAHINAHSSKHTDAILTSSPEIANQFQSGVDSACVFWNTSTRMADGMRFGFGTEVGISTNKIHARGPVGLEGLMIYKYRINGCGQVAGDYGEGGKRWRHERLPLDG
ncbi:hypothetical protein HO133_008201 [Letharia lupina]|uniref:glutamate-5-semialdehyde dehydrogenase n=1 Tax=Letharia lupina TaxID=560253 RepID=A0A8H6FHM6_9LECA|nr:uncharacterized protein HO133_008201 [Letharia lupina]KAF6228471.1 hypothetical protein HO133_008201 [Letharia lupina]